MMTVSLLFLNRQINAIFQLCISVLDVIWSMGSFQGTGGRGGERAPALPRELSWAGAGKRVRKVWMGQTRVRFLLGKAQAEYRALAPLPAQKLAGGSLLKVREDYRCYGGVDTSFFML